MKTTKKQLANFAIGLIKESAKSKIDIEVVYQKEQITIHFFKDGILKDWIDIFGYSELRRNKAKYTKAILMIRGIIV